MEDFLNQLVERLGQSDPLWAYAVLALSAVLENLLPPVPGDTVVVFSAYLVGRGVLGWWPVFLATCLGGTLGFMAMYWIGLSQGRAFLQGRMSRFFSGDSLDKAAGWLQRWGAGLVLANRFLSGIRSVIALSAGIGGMGWKTVAVCGLLSMAAWNGLLLYLGLVLGQNWQQVTVYLQQYSRLLVGLLVLVALVLVWRWRKRRKDLTES